jgi:CHASE2 domain-containing sensor protein
VTPVEVDDDTFYGPRCSGSTPTNRTFLGDLALKAADQNPSVIAFDFQWKGINGRMGDDPIREKDNEHLLAAIRQITGKGIPVVVTTGLIKQADGSFIRQANVYGDSSLPSGTLVGHINLPVDKRKIALKMKSWDWQHTTQTDLSSLSLQVVAAYENELGIQPRTADDSSIKNSARKEWVFGGFFEPTAFPSISAHKLLEGDPMAVSLCRHRIVLIGGTWHTSDGTLIESFPSPVGSVPGLYLHANYIESLLDNRFKQSVPRWLAVILDFFLSMLMYLSFNSVTQTSKRLGVLVAFLLPLTAAYFLFANAGRYLDFMIPLSLCFIDLVRQTVTLR